MTFSTGFLFAGRQGRNILWESNPTTKTDLEGVPGLQDTLGDAGVEEALEDEDSNALERVKYCEDVGQTDTVDGQVEEADHPGGAEEEDEQGDALDVGDDKADVLFACFESVEDHLVGGKEEEPEVAADNDDCRQNEGEDEVVVKPEPAVGAGAVAAGLVRVWPVAHVPRQDVVLRAHGGEDQEVGDKGTQDNQEGKGVSKNQVLFLPARGGCIKDLDQHQVYLETLQQHPGEGCQKEVVKAGSDNSAGDGVLGGRDPEEKDDFRSEEADAEVGVDDIPLRLELLEDDYCDCEKHTNYGDREADISDVVEVGVILSH